MRRTPSEVALFWFLVLSMGLFAPPAAASSAKFNASHSTSSFARDCVGRESEKLFVLSFDDGPWSYTEEILDVLASKGAPATFFLIGSIFDNFPGLTETYEGLVRRMLREGHVVANHGMDNDEFTLDDVDACHRKIKSIVDGHDMQYFRPAQGAYTIEKVEELAADRNYRTVMWNLDPQDWRDDRSPDDMLELLRTAVQNPTAPAASNDTANNGLPRRGSFVMLAHDNQDKMLMSTSGGQTFLGAAIDAIRDAGYRIVSLNECLGVNDTGTVSLTPAPGMENVTENGTAPWTPPPPGTTGNFCGEDWRDAQKCGAGECPSGIDKECPSGMMCFGSVTCTADESDSGSSMRWRMNWLMLGLIAVGALMHLF